MWLVYLTMIVFIAIVIAMPKRISLLEMYSTAWFALCFQQLFDSVFDYKYDWYGFFEKGIQLKSFVIILGLYPAYNMIFLNFFPTSSRFKQALYLAGNVVFLTCYEYVLLRMEILYYNGWKLWQSVLWYPVILLILYWNLLITRWLFAKSVR